MTDPIDANFDALWNYDDPAGTEARFLEVRLTLGAAGKLMSGADARRILEHGADFAILGRAAVLHHDFPRQAAADPDFQAVPLPVTREYLMRERLSPTFVDYMNNWKGFIVQEAPETVGT